MILLDGNKIKEDCLNDIKKEINKFLIKPCLAVIQVGDEEASNTYVRAKEIACNKASIYFKHLKYSNSVREIELINKIIELNNDEHVDGILVQLPLPKHLNETKIINYINYTKDVDGLTDVSIGRLVHNKETNIPCTPAGIMKIFENYNIDVKGKNVVIVGRSNLVGKPLANLLINNDATVTLCHSKTLKLASITNKADILVVATGHKHLINSKMVKENAVIIDVGITRIDGKLYGDVDFSDVKDKVSAITPVPGGVGPMTVTMLLENVIKSYKSRNISK